MSYGPKAQCPVMLAKQLHQILNGANPGELPVEQPTLFGLVVNKTTTDALAITFHHRFACLSQSIRRLTYSTTSRPCTDRANDPARLATVAQTADRMA